MSYFNERIIAMPAGQPSARLTAVVDTVQKAAEVVADLKAQIALKDKQLALAKAEIEAIKAEIADIQKSNIEKANKAQSSAISGVMAILKNKYK